MCGQNKHIASIGIGDTTTQQYDKKVMRYMCHDLPMYVTNVVINLAYMRDVFFIILTHKVKYWTAFTFVIIIVNIL